MLIEDVERLIESYYDRIQISGQTRQNVAGMMHAQFDQLMAADTQELAGLAAGRDRLDNERVKLLQAHYAGAVPIDLLKTEQDRIARRLAFLDAQINADRLMLQLGAGVGAARAGQELDYVRQVSNRLGLELNTTAVSYARFTASAHGTSLEGQGVRQVFDSVSKAAAVMGLNVDETQGVLRALEQMMAKGTVQAEELRGQLGDRLPGALQIAARSLNVTTLSSFASDRSVNTSSKLRVSSA